MSDCSQDCTDRFDRIDKSLEDLHNKLFVGNGQPPITVQIDRLNMFKKLACYFGSILIVAVVGIIARMIVIHLQGH